MCAGIEQWVRETIRKVSRLNCDCEVFVGLVDRPGKSSRRWVGELSSVVERKGPREMLMMHHALPVAHLWLMHNAKRGSGNHFSQCG
jgi:hypothetical protein